MPNFLRTRGKPVRRPIRKRPPRALETEPFGRRGLDRHAVDANPHRVGHRRAHGVDVRAQLGPLHADSAVNVTDCVTAFVQERDDPPQEDFGVDAGEILRRIGEVQPDVAQRGGTQQSIAHGVNRHVAVRVGDEPARVRNLHPAQHQRQPVGQRVHVVSVPDAEIHELVHRVAKVRKNPYICKK